MTDTPETESRPAPAPSPETSESVETDKPRRPFPWRLAAGATGAAVVALAVGWATLPVWVGSLPSQIEALASHLILSPPESAAAVQARADIASLRFEIAALRQETEALRSRVEVTESASSSSGELSEKAVEILQGQIDAARAEVKQVKEQAASGTAFDGVRKQIDEIKAAQKELTDSRAAASSLLALSDRVGQIEETTRSMAHRQDRTMAFLLALGQMRVAVDEGRDFDDALKSVRVLAPEGVAVDTAFVDVAAWSERGIPTLTVLRQSLSPLGAEAIRAGLQPNDASGWVQRTVSRLSALATFRRIDGQATGNDPAALISRAEADLDGGDLASAVAELEKLQGPAAETVFDWLDAARARLGVDRVLGDLTSEALARLKAEPTASGG